MPISLTRRHFLATTAAAGLITGFPAIVRAQSKTIVTTLFGGAYEEHYRRIVLDPFAAAHGVEFVIKYGSADEWLNNAIVNRNDPEIDLPFLSLPVAMRAIRVPDLFLELTPNDVPNLADVHPIFRDVYENRPSVSTMSTTVFSTAKTWSKSRSRPGPICGIRPWPARSSRLPLRPARCMNS